MKQPTMVVMLPTKDITNLVLFNNTLYLNNGYIKEDNQYLLGDEFSNSHQEPAIAFKFQHLYITVAQSIEIIKVGDWYHNATANRVYKCNDDVLYAGTNRKVIATTDPKLTAQVSVGTNEDTLGVPIDYSQLKEIFHSEPIPQVQQSFLKEFVDNPDGEWEVEYDLVAAPWEKYNPNQDPVTFKRLKLNQDNEVTITSVITIPVGLSSDEFTAIQNWLDTVDRTDWEGKEHVYDSLRIKFKM